VDWPESLSDLFPEPRPDEPARLRQDITDELADHLSCALDRQRPLVADDAAAKEAVLARFGNPRTIARRLWFDAMKEKIMSQRITMSLLVVALLLATGAMGMFYQEGRSLRAQSESLLARTEELAHTLQAKLATLEVSNDEEPHEEETPLSLEWAKLQIRLVQEKKGGPPAAGFTARLQGNPINPTQELTLTEESDEEGLIKFGPIRPGGYQLNVMSPWGHSHSHVQENIRASESPSLLVLLPGRTTEIEIACPSGLPEIAEIAFKVDWPEEIAKKKPLLFCYFSVARSHANLDLDGGQWRLPQRNFEVTLNSEGKVLERHSRLPVLPGISLHRPEPRRKTKHGSLRDRFSISSVGSGPGVPRLLIGGVQAGAIGAGGGSVGPIEFVVVTDLPARPTIRTVVGGYELYNRFLFLPSKEQEGAERQLSYNVYPVKSVTPTDVRVFQSFEAVPGELNTWQIKLPEIVLTEVPEKPDQDGVKPARGGRPRG